MAPERRLPPVPRQEAQTLIRALIRALMRALIRAATTTTAPGPNGAGAVGPAIGAGIGEAGEPPTGPLARQWRGS
eukprot:15326206-Alexandrium_andersonii.AAC.1